MPWLVFPRMRQAHVNGLAFGWLSMAMVGGWYYIVPRLTKTKIYSETLGDRRRLRVEPRARGGRGRPVHGLDAGARVRGAGLAHRHRHHGRCSSLTAFNLFMTIGRREEKDLYVSLWYIMGTLIWFPIVFSIGNVIWAPPTGALTGLNDAIWGWFYGHNILGLWFTTGSIPLLYYIVPKEVKRPLYAYTLALIAFWFLAFFYTAVGTHHILQAPVPEWLKVISVVTSVGLLIPVTAFVINMFMTVRGSWRKAFYSIPLRFALTGAFWYMAVSLQGSSQALRGFNQFIHFTNWTVAHAHLALLGLRRLHDVGHRLLRLPAPHRAAAVLRATRVDPLVAHDHRLPRLLLRAHRRRAHAGQRLRAGHPDHRDSPRREAHVDRPSGLRDRHHPRPVPVRLQRASARSPDNRCPPRRPRRRPLPTRSRPPRKDVERCT